MAVLFVQDRSPSNPPDAETIRFLQYLQAYLFVQLSFINFRGVKKLTGIFLLSEGSEDEIEVASETDQMDNSIEEVSYSNNNMRNTRDYLHSPSITLTVKADLYESKFSENYYKNEDEDKADQFYRSSREFVMNRGVVPSELEIKETGGVFARTTIPKGTRYGPFQGKWAGTPQDPRFAWEVSNSLIIQKLCGITYASNTSLQTRFYHQFGYNFTPH